MENRKEYTYSVCTCLHVIISRLIRDTNKFFR